MIIVVSSLLETIKEKKLLDLTLCRIKELLGTNKVVDVNLGNDGILRFKHRVCVPQDSKIKQIILNEGHKNKLSLTQSRQRRCFGSLT